MPIKEKLLELLQAARAREQAFASALGDPERQRQGLPTDWAPKDLVAHMAHWRLQRVDELAMIGRGENPPDFEEFDAANEVAFHQHRTKTWDEVLHFSAETWEALEAAVQGMTEEQLAAPSSLPSLHGRPPWRTVIVDVSTHPMTHLGGYALRHGRADEVTRWEEENAARLAALDSGPSWRGTIRYNMACHYALRGESAKAITALAEALRLNPGLTEWSHHDSDLDSLRVEPAYQALYEAP